MKPIVTITEGGNATYPLANYIVEVTFPKFPKETIPCHNAATALRYKRKVEGLVNK